MKSMSYTDIISLENQNQYLTIDVYLYSKVHLITLFLLSLYLQFQTYDDIVVGNNAKEFLIYGYVPLLQNAPLKSSISTKD